MSEPRVLRVDEMSLGLMPKIVDECYAVFQNLKNTEVATVLVEQNTERELKAANQVLVIEAGNPAWQGEASELARNPEVIEALLTWPGCKNRTFGYCKHERISKLLLKIKNHCCPVNQKAVIPGLTEASDRRYPVNC